MVSPLDALNVAITSEITTEQFVKVAMESLAIPFLVIFLIWTFFWLLVIGLSIANKEARGKILTIIGVSLIFSIAFLIFGLILNPNWFFDIVTKLMVRF